MKKKKNVMYRKSVSLLAAAAMTAVLMTGQVYPVLAEIGNIEANLETSSLIPDNVTIDQPAALSQVALPKSDYGTLSWADGTFVPDKRVQACEVIFKPAENVDLSYLPGWDAQKKVVKGTVNVVVSSLEDTADDTQASSDTAETPSAGESQENGSSDTQAPAENAGETQNPEEAAPAETPTETPAETPSQEPAAENPDVPAASDSTEDTGNSDKADQPENADTAEKAGNTADDLLKDAPVTEAPSAADAILPDETEADNALTAASGEETKEDTSAKITEAAEEDSTPDQAEEPAASEVPAEDTAQNESAGGMLNDKFGDLMPGATVLDEVEPSENTDEATEEDTSSDEKNIFDNPADFTVSDTRPNTAEDDLTEEEQAARAAENHTCEGITVSGIDLPWYVQFQVESGESYEFKNEEKANIFQSYEFKLWDLKNNTEYEIPDGQYVSVTIPVKEGYEYSIEHLLANGATETIVPSVNGSTMVFSTHSFSPFGIAGFRPIIGDEIANGAYGDNGTPTPTPTVTISGTPTPSPSVTGTAGAGTGGTSGTTGTNGTTGIGTDGTAGTGTDSSNGGSASSTIGTADNSGNTSTSGNTGNTSDANSTSGNSGNSSTGTGGTSSANGSSSSNGNSQSSDSTANNNGQSQTSNAVKTGDETTVLPFVLLLMTAAGMVAAVFGIRRKKMNKKEMNSLQANNHSSPPIYSI